jgi:hypothetical protein
MLTLDAVRAAVLSDQPWARLDALVRAELAQGFTTRQLTKALERFAHDIDETEGLSEAGSDAFGDALDALTGFCHKDCQYRDPPNPHLPSEEEIAELPRWARVAFAARCARRVLPLVALNSLAAVLSHGDVRALETRVATSENEARKPTNHEVDALFAVTTATAWIQVHVANIPAQSDARPDTIYSVFQAVSFASSAASPFVNIAPHIRRDFDHLAQLAEVRRWTDDTPVPPDVFGPLWPEGAPKGWPANTDAPARAELVLEAFAGDETTEKKIEDDLVNLFNALNRYHIARSGKRLTLERFRSLVSAHALVEV